VTVAVQKFMPYELTMAANFIQVATLLLVSLCLSDLSAHTTSKGGPMVDIPGGTFWFGSQLMIGDKVIPTLGKDGADPRVKKTVKPFRIEKYAVSNEYFGEFVRDTGYITEAETFTWSFVLEQLASKKVIKKVDSKKGYGRVKDSTHWMAVPGAHWAKPYGKDSPDMLSRENKDLPVVHVSYKDAEQYCAWAGRRLPTEIEWEYAARGGRSKQNYPWGDELVAGRMNVWEGPFPGGNTLEDGYLGLAPVYAYHANAYGLYNVLGNVWEWVAGGTAEKRTLRGGSFVDSADGKFNHIVRVSTRQENSGDSAASNVGFRCAADSEGRHARQQSPTDNAGSPDANKEGL
jgi:formylglycine-generating enzyme required for sulfatase activity